MANNTTRIAEIRAILQAGVSSVNIGGEQVNYDLSALRDELRALEKTDDTQKKKRPMVVSIKLDSM